MADVHPQSGNSSDTPEKNWEKMMDEFDRKQRQADLLFEAHNIVVTKKGCASLSDEENDILLLVLRGVPIA